MISRSNKPDSPERRTAAREFAIELARMAANTRCTNVMVIDVTGLSPVTDFFVVGTGTSNRQMRSVADDAVEFAKPKGFAPLSVSGLDSSTTNWILADFVDVIFHVFSEEARLYYDIENLWAEAPHVEWSDGKMAESRKATVQKS